MVPDELRDVTEFVTKYSSAWFLAAGESSYRQMTFSEYGLGDRVFTSHFVCTRDPAHQLYFFSRVNNGTLTKIGQDPSLADLQLADLQKYRPILGKQNFREFARGVGLAAHGVGIGSFVYLRRIFEELVEEAHRSAQIEQEWDEDQYVRSRMDEKIKLLERRLPEFLIENRHIYGILSKGIHELAEAECLEYFAPVRVGIELILDDKLREKERAEKIAATTKVLGSIGRTIKEPGEEGC